MTISIKQAGLIAGLSVVIGTAGCSRTKAPVDSELQKDLAAVTQASGDLQLAPQSAPSQMVVSAIEGGPSATTAPIAPKAAPKTTPRPAPRASAPQAEPAVAAMPRATVIEAPARAPVEVVPAPAARESEPPPLPAATQGPSTRQKGTYKTEAEIFKQMPWIRP